ncbi:MAG TPA: MFS transporter [Acetobacteraceae bacterium]|nr:MFS transporter [Acetobacteraceae bacterium]
MASTAHLVAALAAMTAASQFHRAALGVVAPELARDLALEPAMLGAANGVFFLALLVAQIPVGIALDRIGPRRCVAGLTALAVIGAGAQGFARDGAELLAARFLLGLGCAASFMSAVVLCARFWRGAALTGALGRVFALSQAGILLSGAPLAALAEAAGWRGALLVSAAATGALGLLWWRLVRDHPPEAVPGAAARESPAETLRGLVTIWRTPGLARVLSMHLVGYAAMATVIGLWAGPYLAEVHGLDARGRGLVLLAMGLALPVGQLVLGRLEAALGSKPRLVTLFALLSAAPLAALALWPQAPFGVAVALLVGLCLFSCYPVVVVTEARQLFPDHLVGRGATTVNLAQVLGSAALPALVGLAVGQFAADAAGLRPEAAYRAGFAVLAGALLAGLAGYRLLPRAR